MAFVQKLASRLVAAGAAAAARTVERRPGGIAHHRRDSDAADERRRRRVRWSSISRSSRSPTAIRAFISRSCRDFLDAPTRDGRRRRADPGRRALGNRGAQCPRGRRSRTEVLPLPPRSSMERTRAGVDGVGAQARQAGRVQPPGSRRDRYDLHDAGRPARCARGHQVLHHARFGYATAARRRARAHRDRLASAEPAGHRSASCGASSTATASCSRASA